MNTEQLRKSIDNINMALSEITDAIKTLQVAMAGFFESIPPFEPNPDPVCMCGKRFSEHDEKSKHTPVPIPESDYCPNPDDTELNPDYQDNLKQAIPAQHISPPTGIHWMIDPTNIEGKYAKFRLCSPDGFTRCMGESPQALINTAWEVYKIPSEQITLKDCGMTVATVTPDSIADAIAKATNLELQITQNETCYSIGYFNINEKFVEVDDLSYFNIEARIKDKTIGGWMQRKVTEIMTATQFDPAIATYRKLKAPKCPPKYRTIE